MIEILEMRVSEIDDLLSRMNFGHLGCSRDDQPYVVPIHFAYAQPYVYIYTTEGMKSEIIASNPNVCLQVEEFPEDGGWRSVMVTGSAEKIVNPVEREKAVDLIRAFNPELLPALAIKWSNDWIRKNVEVVYRIKVLRSSGRFTADVRMAAAAANPAAQPIGKRKSPTGLF